MGEMTFGHMMVGSVWSFTVMVWMQSSEAPHKSDAMYVRVMEYWLGQIRPVGTSLTKVSVTLPPQLSIAVTPARSGAGTWLAHDTSAAIGQITIGGEQGGKETKLLKLDMAPALVSPLPLRAAPVYKAIAPPETIVP